MSLSGPARPLCLFVALAALASGAAAQPDGGAAAGNGAGAVRGRVVDARSGTPLPGALAVIAETVIQDAAGRDGAFRLAGVPAGEQVLVVTYLGYQTVTSTVTVPPGATLPVDVVMSESFALEETVTVSAGSIADGKTRALNQQKTAPNITNVVSADQIGQFPDANAAEATQRIPGITIERDQGEGRYVSVRGAEARLNSMLIDGERIPSPEGDVRAVALDVIPTDLLQAIEVSKALTPDMDGDAIGGAVNLVTKSAPETATVLGSLAGGYNRLMEDAGQGHTSLTGGGRFGDGRIGLIGTVSYDDANRGSDNLEPEYDDGELDDLQLRDYTVNRERTGLNGVLDVRPSADSSFTVRGVHNAFSDQEYRRRTRYRVGDDSIERELKDRFETQKITSFSRRRRALPGQPRAARLPGVGGPGRGGRAGTPRHHLHPGGRGFRPQRQPHLHRSARHPGESRQRRPRRLHARRPGRREQPDERPRRRGRGEPPGAVLDRGRARRLAQVRGQGPPQDEDARQQCAGLRVGRRPLPGRLSRRRIPTAGVPRRSVHPRRRVHRPESRPVAEKHVAAGVRGGPGGGPRRLHGDRGPRRRLRHGGPRAELPPVAAHRAPVRADPPGLRRLRAAVRRGGRPGLPEPGGRHRRLRRPPAVVPPALRLHRRHQPARGGDALAGPAQLLRPRAVPVDPRGRQRDRAGQPHPRPHDGLEPRPDGRALPAVGGRRLGRPVPQGPDRLHLPRDVRGAARRRRVRRAGAAERRRRPHHRARAGVPEPVPGAAGAARRARALRQLHLRGFLAQFPGQAREERLPGQARHSGNLSVWYEKRGFSARVSLNVRDRWLAEVGEEPAEDVYLDAHRQLDLSVGQALTSRLRLFADFLNLTNEPLRFYEGVVDRPIQEEYYRWWTTFGMRFTF